LLKTTETVERIGAVKRDSSPMARMKKASGTTTRLAIREIGVRKTVENPPE
jgi:hypothetical protein